MNSRFKNLNELKKNMQWYSLEQQAFGPPKKWESQSGGVPVLYDRENQRIYLDSRDNHSMIIGATGSLKTRTAISVAVRLLGKAGESMIINDPKSELYDRLAGELARQGYEIIVLNMRQPDQGHGWNPLYLPYRFYLKGDMDHACEFIDDIASNLTNEDSSADPFWNNSARTLTFGLILLLFKYCKDHQLGDNAVNISNVLLLRRELFSTGVVRPSATPLWQYAATDELIAANLSGSVFAPNDTRNSILSVFDEHMRIFATRPTLTEMLSNNDFDIADIGRKSVALFMIVPDEKTTLAKLSSLFIKQSYEYLIHTASKEPDRRVTNRVNYCLDEFTSSISAVDDFPAMITASRSRNIRFTMAIQSKGSLKRRYKEDADTIISNCSNIIYFTSRELPLLQELSELCGKNPNGTTPNISVYELQRLSKDKREALILSGREAPTLVEMIDIDDRAFGEDTYDVLCYPTPHRKQRQVLPLQTAQRKTTDAEASPFRPQPKPPVKPAPVRSPEETAKLSSELIEMVEEALREVEKPDTPGSEENESHQA